MTRWLVTLLFVFVVVPASVRGERLPIKIYTTADGLAHNVVNRVVHDSRGFLWFCTREGLSRFDGYSFESYGTEHGLPSAEIADLLEARDGVHWIATRGGLVRFDPLGHAGSGDGRAAPERRMFTTYRPPGDARAHNVTSLFQDRAGAMWVGTAHGLYRMDVDSAGTVTFALVDLGIPDRFEMQTVSSLAEDRFGALWIGTMFGLDRRLADGTIEHHVVRAGPPLSVQSLLIDSGGRLWVGLRAGGLARMAFDQSGRARVERTYDVRGGLPHMWITQIVETSNGQLWAGTPAGLVKLLPTIDGTDYTLRTYSRSHGLPYHDVHALAEDGNRNLWIGTTAGVTKMLPGGPVVFDEADDLAWVSSLAQTQSGDVLAIGGPLTRWSVNRFEGSAFLPGQHRLFESQQQSWAWSQGLLVDHLGDWWIATRAGVLRFHDIPQMTQLAGATPVATYTRRDGLSADVVIRLFEDSRGDVWIATVGEGTYASGLSRWERQSGAFHHYTERDGLPPFGRFYVSALAEDAAGGVWVGLTGDAGIMRYRNGRFTRFAPADGGPRRSVRNLLVDAAGRVWIATFGAGLGRVDRPTVDRPAFTWYTTTEGLSSNEVGAVSDDARGHIYAGTARGIDQLDPATGRITRRYSISDGLPTGELHAALRDRLGALWFSYSTGLARLVPEPEPPQTPPPILIAGVRVGGEPHAMSELGQADVPAMELLADRNQIQIDFVAIDFAPGGSLHYQFKLDEADEAWSAPSDQRSVTFANLAPGAYRFHVRAVNAQGLVSDAPASVAFTIPPPLWQRWWFVTLAVGVLAAVLYALYRYRMTRVLEVAHMRARIATDLHDDIGANLTRIAVLSEVARQQSGNRDSPASVPLASIATVARESVASMDDIVWAINPERDRLRDLTRRMREHAEELFSLGDVTLAFTAPESTRDGKLTVDVRREVFLIFKEAVNNAARHAGAAHVRVAIGVSGAGLQLEVIDDGVGFDPTDASEGNGVASMRKRAARLGALLDVVSQTNAGTTVRLAVPLSGASPRRERRPTPLDR